MARNDLLYSFLQTLTLLVFTNADSHGIFVNNCVEFDRVLVQEYRSTLETASLRQNYSTRSADDSQHLSPFGTSPKDWTRLILLRDALPEDSTIRKNFEHLFTILLVAHDQASKTNRSSQQQEVVNNLEHGKTVSSSLGKNTTLQISLDTESHFENSFPVPKMNDSIVKFQSNGTKSFLRNSQNSTSSSVSISSSETVGKNLTSPREKVRKILGLTSFDLGVAKIPLIGKKESEESATPEHFPNSNEQLSKSPEMRDKTLCNHSSSADDYMQPFKNNRSGFIENGKIHQFNSPENQKTHSLQSSDELSISRKQEDGRRDSTHFPEEFSSPRTFANNQSLPYQFLTMTQNSGLSRSTDQQLGTSSWTEYSTETEEYFSAKILSSTPTPPILISAASKGLATEGEQVQKYPWKIANDSLSKIKSPMMTPTFLTSTSKRNEIKKVSKPGESWLEDRIPTEASIVNFKSKIEPSPLPSPQENQFPAEEKKIEKSNDTDFSTKLKTDSNSLKASVSNQTKAGSTPGAHNRSGEDCKSRTQDSSSVSLAEQTEMTGNSWTTSSIFADNEKTVDDVQTPSYGEKIKVPDEGPRHLSIRNNPKTDNSLNPSIKSIPKKPTVIGTPLRNENSTERRDYGVDQRIKDAVTVTVSTESSSPSIPRDPQIPFFMESFVKNVVRPNSPKNYEISRDYKHDIKDFGAARKNLEDRPRNVYEFGVSAKNRSFWRQKLEQNLRLAANDTRRSESKKGNSKPINIPEKSSNDTESNVPITKESNDSSKSPTHGRINELRPRKGDSENRDIEQKFSWFYRQGQTEDRSKSRPNEKDKTKIKVRCKNPRH